MTQRCDSTERVTPRHCRIGAPRRGMRCQLRGRGTDVSTRVAIHDHTGPPRTLPLVIEPHPDESLWSWLMRFSNTIDRPPGLLARDLRLPVRPNWTGGARVICFGVVLPERQAEIMA